MLEITTVISMLIILGFTWGGFLYFANRAYRHEQKAKKGE